MTLAVLGLDAADPRLAERWDCANLLLDAHGDLESFAHSRDTPLTAEVWPVVATGRMPGEDGESGGKRGADWTGPLAVADSVAKWVVPQSWRSTVGRYLRVGRPGDAMFGPDGSGSAPGRGATDAGPGDGPSGDPSGGDAAGSAPTAGDRATGDAAGTARDHAFSEGAVYNWPGLTPTRNWKRAEYWLQQYYDGAIDDGAFLRRQLAFTGQEVGWLAAMAQAGLPVVGVHAHVLDHAGHAWARQPGKLRTAYEHVDRLAGLVRRHDAVSDLVVCSDHGMQTTVTGDDDPGHHSLRGLFATTVDDDLPAHVADVRAWLDRHAPEPEPLGEAWDERGFDTPTEHLRDLGYLE